jgi:hypothetical protein
MKLSGNTVLVTGSATGIGLAMTVEILSGDRLARKMQLPISGLEAAVFHPANGLVERV